MRQQDLIDAHEVARRLGYCYRHVLRLARQKKIPTHRFTNGHDVRFSWLAVEKAVAKLKRRVRTHK